MVNHPYEDILYIKRPPLKHQKMPVENRAKSYAPFDALRGFSLALLTKQAERQMVTRIMLSDDAQEQLDRKLHMVQSGDKIAVTYFCLERVIGGLELGTYIRETGEVEDIDTQTGILFLSTACVPIQEIIEIESDAFGDGYADQEVEPDAEPDETEAVC